MTEKEKEDDIKYMLDRYSDILAQMDAIRLHYENIRDQLIPKEIKDQLRDVDEEEKMSLEAAKSGAEKLAEEIRIAILQAGRTVPGSYHTAVYNHPKSTWISATLEELANKYPEILDAKKTGQPYASIRSASGGKQV